MELGLDCLGLMVKVKKEKRQKNKRIELILNNAYVIGKKEKNNRPNKCKLLEMKVCYKGMNIHL